MSVFLASNALFTSVSLSFSFLAAALSPPLAALTGEVNAGADASAALFDAAVPLDAPFAPEASKF